MRFERLEHEEQADMVKLLRRAGLFVFSVPNGASLSGDKSERARQVAKLKREGMLPGMTDLVIGDPPPNRLDLVCTCVEMKRRGGVDSDVSENQKKVHADLHRLGWLVIVANGVNDGLEKLRAYGYEV